MGKGGDVSEAIAAVLLGIAGGLAAAALIDYLSSSKCPVCNNRIPRGTAQCPSCGVVLEWK
jgi:hypothetical protein